MEEKRLNKHAKYCVNDNLKMLCVMVRFRGGVMVIEIIIFIFVHVCERACTGELIK